MPRALLTKRLLLTAYKKRLFKKCSQACVQQPPLGAQNSGHCLQVVVVPLKCVQN